MEIHIHSGKVLLLSDDKSKLSSMLTNGDVMLLRTKQLLPLQLSSFRRNVRGCTVDVLGVTDETIS